MLWLAIWRPIEAMWKVQSEIVLTIIIVEALTGTSRMLLCRIL